MCDPRQGLAQRIDSIHVKRLEPETQIREQVKQHHDMTAATTGLLISVI